MWDSDASLEAPGMITPEIGGCHIECVMWDSAVSLEAQGTITVVMMLEGDFLNGLHGDMDF